MALAACLATGSAARPTASLDGAWSGDVSTGAGQSAGTAAGALVQSGRTVGGTLTIDAAGAAGVFTVTGTLRGMRAVLKGKGGARRMRWKARFDRTTGAWRGPLAERGGGPKMHATLALAPDAGGGPTCGGDYFASDVMPVVIDPICSQCHVPGGQAQAAAFKVTPGNAKATARSAAKEVDPLDPTHSKLIAKPRGDLPHGGGKRILPGSTEEATLLHWIALVTAPGCDLGGGSGGGGGGTGADLYAENCASCHGPDARGLDGRPDIHCNRDVSDAVHNGRSGPAGDMQAFTNLTDGDIAKIQAFLDGLCPVDGVTGAELFTSNCATCHGADATGSATAPGVRCATRAPDAMHIGRGAAMPSFPAITDPEVALVDAFLTALCDQSGRPGADLYVGNCSTCHGTTAAGGKNGLGVEGPDIQCSRGIATPVTSGKGTEMPAFPGLAPADVTAVQQYLTTAFCPADTATGAALYASNCASCHGADAHGVDGKPDIRCNRGIHDAVLSGRTGPSGTMPPFAMTDVEIGRVQDYLVGLCPVGSASGGDLFASNCATCHGGDATGTATAPNVRCATRVADAVQQGRGEKMPAFPGFAPSEVTTLQGWLDGLCTANGRPAPELFTGNCSTCHGTTATGGTNGLGVTGPDIHCSRGIATPLASGQGTDMPAFPGLGAGDVTTLQQYLIATFCPIGTATGADLYASNCASCHGADARGVDGKPNIRCNRAIHDVVVSGRTGPAGTMPAFTLTDGEIGLVQDYLVGLCPAGGATGADLFGGNCATCHGADALGTATAPNVRCATRVADAVQQGRGDRMPAFPGLVPVDVTNVQAFLTGLCTGSGRQGTDLYAGNCSTCHGPSADGGTNGLGVAGPDIHCSRGIATPVASGEGAMPAFPGLGSTDVATLQQYLASTFCPVGTATGSDLYTSNCAVCHGADARGIDGKPDIRCNRSIHDVVLAGRTGASGTMPPFVMSDPEIALVQGFLVGLCPIGSATGDELFASNCATCHGPGGVGTATAIEVRCATRVADAMQKGRGARMPSFPGVVTTEVTSIQGYLTGICNQLGRPGQSLYVGNCSTCHGATAGGGQNGLGVRGPDVQCTGANDFTEKIHLGGDGMPPFPAFSTNDITAVVDYVHAAFCTGG